MKKKIINILFGLCFLLLFVSSAWADVISETLNGQELLFERNYSSAIELFKKIEQDYPESPAGTFGQIATWQIMMFENSDFRFKEEYKSAEKRFEEAAYRLLQRNPSSWDLFITGSGYGMRGFYYAREGRWFRALGSAVRAIQLLKRAKFEDKEFIDAYLGIGMYAYWRSVLTKGLHFLPFFGDRRKEGIEDVERVIKEGQYAKKLAEANMAFMLAREKQYDKARAILEDYLEKYPNNIILRQLSGDIYIDTKKYDNALAEYKRILEIDPAMTKSLYRLGRISMRAGKKADAIKYFEGFLATTPEKEWKKATLANLKQLKDAH